MGALYRALYALVARLAARVLAGRRGVAALYLTRGAARGAITPGVSDIDFIVVTDDEPALVEVRAAGRRLSRFSAGLVEYYPNFATSRASLVHRWRTMPAWQYRYQEGRRSWKLLAGEPLLAALAPLSEAQNAAACHLELCRWWTLYAGMLADDAWRRDRVLRNATCYKAVSEVLGVDRFRRTGEHFASRDAALEADGSPFALRLVELAAGRYLADDSDVVEETGRFLFRFFTELWRGFAERPFLRVVPGVTQELDEVAAPPASDPALLAELDALGAATARWPGAAPRVHLLASVFWPAGESLFVVEGRVDAPPGAAELAALVGGHRARRRAGGPPADLVLRLGPVGFPLTPRIPRELHRGLLTPATTPDVFLLLGEREVFWTELAAWYLGAWRDNEQWTDASEATRERLASVAAGAARGRIVYPRPAVATRLGTARERGG